MIEIEAKVRLNRTDLKRLLKWLQLKAEFKGKSVKTDDYYTDSKQFSLRLRRKGGPAGSLNIKSKKQKRGIESNQEVKLPIRSVVAFHSLLKKLGFQKKDHKRKISVCYEFHDFHIELNHIVGLGDYLEIEILVRRQKDISEAKKRLRALFQVLGFSPIQFEKKYYLELLREQKKNQ